MAPCMKYMREESGYRGAKMNMETIEKAKIFFKEAQGELKKVVWPTKQQTLVSTRVVIIFVLIVSAFLGVVDFVLGRLIKYILS